jgi:hypothetical protein
MIENYRAAYVNRSGTTIPVYEKFVTNSLFNGNTTAGGAQIGTITPGEFYTLIPNSNGYQTSWKIVFRHNGAKLNGVIESSKGITLGNQSWAASQEPYHYSNSNGSSLVNSTPQTINGTLYRIFTVNKAVTYRNPSGSSQGTLAVGTKLATYESTTRQTYADHMLFRLKKVGSGSWTNLVSGGTYGFVDLGFTLGSSPSARAIR